MAKLKTLGFSVPALQPACTPLESRSATVRIRGRQLQQIRKRVLEANPLCVDCEKRGIVRAAVHVDHVVALGNGGDESRTDDSNRQGLCEDCHARKSKADLRGMAYRGGI